MYSMRQARIKGGVWAISKRLAMGFLISLVSFVGLYYQLKSHHQRPIDVVAGISYTSTSNPIPSIHKGSGSIVYPATGVALIVESTEDLSDVMPGDGACRSAANTCTLRAAIAEANAHAGPDHIQFNIEGAQVHSIRLRHPLPPLNDVSGPTTIDGYTQDGATPNSDPLVSNAQMRVQLVGDSTFSFDAITITSSGNVIRGLALFGFHRAIRLVGSEAAGNRIVGNFIGTDANGLYSAPTRVRGAHGLEAVQGAHHNQVGGLLLSERNIISGNAGHGIGLWHHGTDANRIVNNIIGLSPLGERRLANQGHGIDINHGATANVVGGLRSTARNVVSGNNEQGIEISHEAATTQNLVIGNLVGTNVEGTEGTSYSYNGAYGIILRDDVGGNLLLGNVIGNNRQGGIGVIRTRSSPNRILNSWIGRSPQGRMIANGGPDIEVVESRVAISPGNHLSNHLSVAIAGDAARVR